MNETLNSLFYNEAFYHDIFSKKVRVSEEVVAPNVKLIQQGKKYDCFYYIKSGQLRVVINELHQKKNIHTVINKLGAGDVFGEFVIFNDAAAGADVITVSECTIIKIEVNSFKAFLESDPELGYKVLFGFLQAIVTRVQRINVTVLNIMEQAMDYQKMLTK